jgi:hypothetical protein
LTAVVLDFRPRCRGCNAKNAIVKRFTTDPLGKILELEICEKCGILQSDPKPSEMETI